MAKKTYLEKLTLPQWQRRRLKIMQRDDFKCLVCGDDKTKLSIHHLKYTREPWDAPNEDLITVCEDCHKQIELLKEEYLGKLNEIDFGSIKILKSMFDNGVGGKMFYIKHSGKIFLKIYSPEGDCTEYIEFGSMSRTNIANFFCEYINKDEK